MMKQNRKGSRACCAKGVETEGVVIVKARRGEATDCHSLAERGRRAKIRMRMKLLQSLVPGCESCDKITGKARVLDETIKYVQFLQNQVESLAAKIAVVDHPLLGCQHNVNKNASVYELQQFPHLVLQNEDFDKKEDLHPHIWRTRTGSPYSLKDGNSDTYQQESSRSLILRALVTLMAAAELPPPESTVPAALTTATSSLPPLIPSPSTAPITTAQPPQTTENHPGPQLQPGQKRQRRPSVRLGEIGDQPAATVSIDSNVRRAARYPHWKLPKDSSSKSVKARSITNLVNGHDAAAENGGDFRGGGVDSSNRKVKSKRAAATRRVRSNWTSSSKIDDGEEWMSADQSPARSPAEDNWENEQEEDTEEEERRGWGGSDSRENNDDDDGEEGRSEEMPESNWSGVRTWLIELGLSRYTPVFEIHEVDDEVLPLLTLEDLKDMGINAVGSRRKMYGAILKLRKGFS